MNYCIELINDNNSYNKLLSLWNNEMGFIYPITEKAFYQNVINYKEKIIYGAYINDQLKGFIILKFFTNPILTDYERLAFISLFYVSKKYRRQGIGSRLLEKAESHCIDKTIWFGKDINNFFPAIPTDFDNLTDVWLEKRGYSGTRYTHDLISYKPIVYPIINHECGFYICKEEEKEELIDFLKNNNWLRWAYEANEYFKEDGINKGQYIIVRDLKSSNIIGFVRINTNFNDDVPYNVMWQDRFSHLGGIGPLGVDKKYRKLHLGQDIISYAINTLYDRQVKEFMIDWTGLLELYQKFNFEVWKSYKYMYKNI